MKKAETKRKMFAVTTGNPLSAAAVVAAAAAVVAAAVPAAAVVPAAAAVVAAAVVARATDSMLPKITRTRRVRIFFQSL